MSEATSTFDRMWADLAPIGRDPGTGGYRRHAWTAADATLREWFAAEVARRGLDLTDDRAGNLWAWWGDPDAAAAAGDPGVATGSHLDSVPDGGAYDGPLGVVSALAALDALRARGFSPARPIGVALFCDEEGARFGVACVGSRLLTGALPAERALALTDGEGLTMAQALALAGRDPSDVGPDPQALRRVGAFVELHIEQGRALAPLGRPLGVADAIWPHGRWRLDLPGRADHAGTTALADRHDALLACAGVVLEARQAALRHGALATVGKLTVLPGAVNAVPGHVTAWLDARGAQEEAVRATVADVAGAVRDLGGTLAQESWTAPTRFDPRLRDRIAALLGDAPVLGTGAGHDAGVLAGHAIPTAMLFVRNPTGVSHSPGEHADHADCLAGVAALADVLADLAGAAGPP